MAIVSLYAKNELPAAIWLEGRARADLRWIDDDYSTRYRFRLEATREFSVLDRPVRPTSTPSGSTTPATTAGPARWKAGTEVTVNKRFRYELYLARQKELLPDDESIAAVGVAAKWFY